MSSVLTFAYLRDLQKKERTSRKLEKLPGEFYTSLSEYAARKGQQKDVESALPVIKYILERREQKVLELAVMSVGAGIAPENLLPEEKTLFDAACELLKKYHEKTEMIFNGTKKDEGKTKENSLQKGEFSEVEADKKPGVVKIRALKDIPEFIAEDFAAHGPWKEGDVVECLPKAAKILLENGFAEITSGL